MFNQNAALGQGTDIPSFNGEFVQYAADNVDHNSRTLDGHDTFHGMGMIAVVTPGTKFSRNVTRRKVSSEEISATGKVEIHPCGPRQVNVEIKYKDLTLVPCTLFPSMLSNTVLQIPSSRLISRCG